MLLINITRGWMCLILAVFMYILVQLLTLIAVLLCITPFFFLSSPLTKFTRALSRVGMRLFNFIKPETDQH